MNLTKIISNIILNIDIEISLNKLLVSLQIFIKININDLLDNYNNTINLFEQNKYINKNNIYNDFLNIFKINLKNDYLIIDNILIFMMFYTIILYYYKIKIIDKVKLEKIINMVRFYNNLTPDINLTNDINNDIFIKNYKKYYEIINYFAEFDFLSFNTFLEKKFQKYVDINNDKKKFIINCLLQNGGLNINLNYENFIQNKHNFNMNYFKYIKYKFINGGIIYNNDLNKTNNELNNTNKDSLNNDFYDTTKDKSFIEYYYLDNDNNENNENNSYLFIEYILIDLMVKTEQ